VHASIGEILFALLSPRRLHIIGMERMPRLRQAEERAEDASTAEEQYGKDLKALTMVVRRQLGEAQATYQRAIDTCTKEMNNTLKAGDWVYLDIHSRSPKMLGFWTQGPYMVLRADGHRFLVESPRGSPHREQ